jgi:16S rRNA (cytosine1402-N4)-methyltransferase
MTTTMNDYHVPVLLRESIEGLALKENGVYIDVTFGGGGHSREILRSLQNGRLIAFDQDADAASNVPEDDRFELVDQNFRFLKSNLKVRGIRSVDGILADLGVSSHQFDIPGRGFSFRFEGPLDMRMDQSSERTAAMILNNSEEEDLANMFFKYGELRNSRSIARSIVQARSEQPFGEASHLLETLRKFAPAHKSNQFFARVFQALRMEVNQEMGALEAMLEQAAEMLSPGGRLVVISYHSLEDRMVKHFMKFGNFEGTPRKDFYGNVIRPLKMTTSKPIVPSVEEIEKNSRARSARLRIAEKP